jgi:hypothetical protein
VKELIPQIWDDMELVEGRRVPAGPGPAVVLRLDTKTVELDLTTENRELLAKLLEPWLKAGTATHGGARTGAGLPGGSKLAVKRAYNQRMRAWGAANGFTWSKNAQGKMYYPAKLKAAYAAHLEATAAGS